jgi:hypothetical protein
MKGTLRQFDPVARSLSMYKYAQYVDLMLNGI